MPIHLATNSLLGGLLGGGGGGGSPFGGGGGGDAPSSGSSEKPEPVDDPVEKKQKFTDPATGTSIMVGAKPTDKGILISTIIDNAPGGGTFQTAFLEDSYGRLMQPIRYEVYALYLEWSLTVSWTKDTYVDGEHVKHEEGGWSEGGIELLDVFTRVVLGKPIWKRLGFNRAVDGVKGLGTEFALTTQQLQSGDPVAFVVHITRPGEDPVTTTPFTLLASADKDGNVSFKKVDKGPAEQMCDEALPLLASAVPGTFWATTAIGDTAPASSPAPAGGAKTDKPSGAKDAVDSAMDDIGKSGGQSPKPGKKTGRKMRQKKRWMMPNKAASNTVKSRNPRAKSRRWSMRGNSRRAPPKPRLLGPRDSPRATSRPIGI